MSYSDTDHCAMDFDPPCSCRCWECRQGSHFSCTAGEPCPLTLCQCCHESPCECRKIRAFVNKIVCVETSFDYPPIPVRTSDWSAWRQDDEETGPFGRGRTREMAVENLLEELEEQNA